ncbi:hypothetical protein D3C85_1562140 [compost metagenome]
MQLVALAQAGAVVVHLFETVVADQAVAVASDLFATVVTDLGVAVVEDQLLDIALRPQVDFFLPGAVFKRQLVVTTGVRGAVATQDGFGLVFGQRIRHGGDGVGHTPGDQRLVGVAFQVGHHDFHADARDGHGTETFPRPAG